MKNDTSEKIYFEPSTIENIDKSVLDYVSGLKLRTATNEGSDLVPVVWGTSERSYISKGSESLRDKQGMLKLPIISVKRTGFSKPLGSKGVFQGNVPEENDVQGGSLIVSRKINQEKTNNFAKADSKRQTGQENYPVVNQKIVYQTVTVPMPVNVELTYEIILRTEYQQQMNDLMLPFITVPGTINYVNLKSNGHRYEGFLQDQYGSRDNLSNYSSEERKFETSINLRVVGYLVGHGINRERPHFAVRENAVEIKIPREKVIVDPDELKKYGL
tara:strand:- start:1131 stop:1949 length:819 start_codon:yes stop_codon:yes gene_type:complete